MKNKGKFIKITDHILFAILLITTVVLSLIELSTEFSMAAKSDGISRLGPAFVAVAAGTVIISEMSLWVSTARVISDVQCKKWFWTAYDSVTALLSFAAGYTTILYRIGKISNQASIITLYALGGYILLQVTELIVREENNLKNGEPL